MKYNVNFHETFPVTFEYIVKILEISNGNRELSKQEISNMTGIPTGASSGKVEPHIKYAKFMNLIDYKFSKGLYVLKRTKLGEEIYLEDPYLTEEITYILLNYFLTSPSVGAEMWSLLYRNLMRKYQGEIKLEVLLKEMVKKYGEKVKILPLLNTYKNNQDKFNFIEIEEDKLKKIKKSTSIESTYIYAYTLLMEWEKSFDDIEITIDHLDSVYWKEGFNFNSEEEFKVLNLLEENKIIKLNKQLSPLTIVKLKNSSDCIKKIYSLLI